MPHNRLSRIFKKITPKGRRNPKRPMMRLMVAEMRPEGANSDPFP